MSYVAGGKTYDEGGNEIDAFGNRLDGVDPNVGQNQAKSAAAANMGAGSSASGGATIEDYTKASQTPGTPQYVPPAASSYFTPVTAIPTPLNTGTTEPSPTTATDSSSSYVDPNQTATSTTDPLATTYAGGTPDVTGGEDPRLAALYDELTKRAGQSLTVDANDPGIASQVNAAGLTGQRSLLMNQKAAAERLGSNQTGAINANAAQGMEALGANLQNVTAGAIGKEIDARRAEIAQALSGQQGILTQEQQAKLREQDQALEKRSQDIQNQQFGTTEGRLERQQAWSQSFAEKGFNASEAQRLWADAQSGQQQAWMQAFAEKGFSADEAARLWQEMFTQNQADRSQGNTIWNQNWLLSGGGQ